MVPHPVQGVDYGKSNANRNVELTTRAFQDMLLVVAFLYQLPDLDVAVGRSAISGPQISFVCLPDPCFYLNAVEMGPCQDFPCSTII
jgi:hypothetical protein